MTYIMTSLIVDHNPSKAKLSLLLDGNCFVFASNVSVYPLRQMSLSVLAAGCNMQQWHVTHGRVTAILYSRLAMRLRSLAIVLPIYIYICCHSHPRLQPDSYNYDTSTYEAERRHTCPYIFIAWAVCGYVSLMGLRVDEFTPFLTRDTIKSTIESTVFKTIYQTIITAKHELLTVPSLNCA